MTTTTFASCSELLSELSVRFNACMSASMPDMAERKRDLIAISEGARKLNRDFTNLFLEPENEAPMNDVLEMANQAGRLALRARHALQA